MEFAISEPFQIQIPGYIAAVSSRSSKLVTRARAEGQSVVDEVTVAESAYFSLTRIETLWTSERKLRNKPMHLWIHSARHKIKVRKACILPFFFFLGNKWHTHSRISYNQFPSFRHNNFGLHINALTLLLPHSPLQNSTQDSPNDPQNARNT